MTIYLILDFLVHFSIELCFIFLLHHYYLFQICVTIDILLSSFLYFSTFSLYIIEVFNFSILIYSLYIGEIILSSLWIYLMIKNYIRYLFFFHFYKNKKPIEEEINKNEVIDFEI